MAIVTVFGNNIVHNLKELAKFDLRTDIQKMGGSKLNIDTRTGQFNMGTGWGNALNRNAESSLTQADNRKTVTNLLEAALDQFKQEGVTQNAEFRKALIDALRGYRWLLSSYMANRTIDNNRITSYETSLEELDGIQNDFCDSLKDAVNKMNGFHRWFATAQPEMKFNSLGQSVYMSDDALLGNGICAGITIKWLCRWVVSAKSSILDSSKRQSQEQALFEMKLNREVSKWKSNNPAEWREKITNHGGEAAANFQVREEQKAILAENPNRRVFDTTLDRLQKKGSEMYITMHEQGVIKKGGNLMNTVQYAKDIATQQAQKNANRAIETKSGFKQRIYMDRAEEFQKQGESYDKVARRWGEFHMIENQDTNDFLNRIAAKYENASSGASVTHPFNKPMYFRDASEFYDQIRANFEPLISDSFTELNRGIRVGFYIGWKAGDFDQASQYRFSYRDSNGNRATRSGRSAIKQESGHALGFHITPNHSFLVFDPNYGEFGCATGDDVIKHFSRWFSLYSRKYSLVAMRNMKIYWDDRLLDTFQNYFP
jgi:hypothetical protein